jgi:hypothetical protein
METTKNQPWSMWLPGQQKQAVADRSTSNTQFWTMFPSKRTPKNQIAMVKIPGKNDSNYDKMV